MITYRAYFAHALLDWLFDQLRTAEDPDTIVGVLYDIGCNLEKGLIRVSHVK